MERPNNDMRQELYIHKEQLPPKAPSANAGTATTTLDLSTAPQSAPLASP